MALRRTTTVAPAPPDTAPPPAAGPAAPRQVRSRAERLAPYLFVAPLLAVFAVFYLWPALVTVLSSFFRWGLLRPWSPVEPDRWRFVGLDNYTTTLTDPSFWNAVLNTAIWLVVFPALVVAFSLLVSILVWYTGHGGTVYRTVFILPMTISLAAAGVIWSFVYNADPQIGVLNAVLDRLGIRPPPDQPGPDRAGVLGVHRLRRHHHHRRPHRRAV
jgi:ABC-type sugar transport system permease subunit